MQDNQFVYTRHRRKFGRQCLFVDRTQQMLSINPNSKTRHFFILANPVDTGTQLSKTMALDIMETINIQYANHGMYHHEGGWPKEINIYDEESTMRHKKKIERDDIWGIQVMNLIEKTKTVIEENNVVNIYENYFEKFDSEDYGDLLQSFEARLLNIYHDIYMPPRCVRQIDWAPSEDPLFLAQHMKMRSLDQEEIVYNPPEVGSVNSFYVWSITDSVKPAKIFDSSVGVSKAMYCPKDEHFIAGGLNNGGVCIWNSRDGGMPTEVCPLESAHREKSIALCWVHSKSNSEFYTGGFDGSIKFWDSRDLIFPIQEVLLDPDNTDTQSRARAHGVSVLEFEYTIPVRFIIGSDLGFVFVGNRKGMTPLEILLANYQLCKGPIRTIERNPSFVKNFLVAGDWCSKIWTEEHKGAPMSMVFKKKNQVSCASWSTLRCSLFVTGDESGELDFYDLLLDQRDPIFTMNFKSGITHAKFRPDGEALGVSLQNGDVYILELDEAMKKGTTKDKALVASLFEREQQRNSLLEGRFEEIKLKERNKILAEEQLQEEKIDAEATFVPVVLDPEDPEQFLQLIESDVDYTEALNRFKKIAEEVEAAHQSRNYIMQRTEFEQYCFVDEEEQPEALLPITTH